MPGVGNLRRVGLRRAYLSDTYHFLLSARWAVLLLIVVCGYLLANLAFGLAYMIVGGIENARPGSFVDGFYFSVQTMATIGYGRMAPVSHAAQALVTAEALCGLLGFAVATSIIFNKFARPTARVMFARVAVVCMREGVPSLQFRMANERGNQIVEATVQVAIVRTDVTAEGEQVLRVYDLPLVRSRSAVFALTWTAVHPIDETSPLRGVSAAGLAARESRIIVSLTGVDETFAQSIYARHTYAAHDVLFDARFVDLMSYAADGVREIDYTKFHDTEPAPPSTAIPAQAASEAGP